LARALAVKEEQIRAENMGRKQGIARLPQCYARWVRVLWGFRDVLQGSERTGGHFGFVHPESMYSAIHLRGFRRKPTTLRSKRLAIPHF
jgi:hypothetical protein